MSRTQLASYQQAWETQMDTGQIGAESPSFKKDFKKNARQAYDEFRPAFASSGPYVLLGLFAGFLCIAAHYLFILLREILEANKHSYLAIPWGVSAVVFEHLGIGLIVAAIAVFFYEWGAHIKKTIERGDRLAKAMDLFNKMKSNEQRSDELTRAVHEVDGMLTILNTQTRANEAAAATGKQALERGLNIVIGGVRTPTDAFESQVLREAVANCGQLIFAIESLRITGTWPNYRYIKFLSDLLKETVGENAEKFSTLYKTRKGEQHFMVPPNAAEMADAILATQIEAIVDGDSYDVISDLGSWDKKQLAKLHRATSHAVNERDVCVRRVFNLYDLPRPFKSAKEMRDAKENISSILNDHLLNSREWKGKNGRGCYQIKILKREAFQNLKRKYGIEKAELHFGIFSHHLPCEKTEKIKRPNETSSTDEAENSISVVFKVSQPDLSDMALTIDPELIKKRRNIFDDAWLWATELPVDEAASKLLRDLLDQWGDDCLDRFS